jgi:hypothetical protein
LAISDVELWALREHLHKQISQSIQVFWQQRFEQMAKREQELAERRHQIEIHKRRYQNSSGRWIKIDYAAALRERRRHLPPVDWELQAAHKVHEQNLAQLGAPATLEDLFGQVVPHVYEFASMMAGFERTVIPQLPPSRRHAHSERVVRAIVRMILPDRPAQAPLLPRTKSVRLSEEQTWAGKVIAGPFEIELDKHQRPIRYRSAPYAERRGVFEHALPDPVWGLLHAPEMQQAPRRLAARLRVRLRSDLVQMADDDRTRRQMADDCKGFHHVVDKDIAGAARVALGEFYQWRADNPRIPSTSLKHRRILFVVCCPVWPPPRI